MQMELADMMGSIPAIHIFDQAALPYGSRIFTAGKRASCIELALHTARHDLLMCEAIQNSINRAWNRVSRYHFYIAATLYMLLVVLVST